MDREDMDKIPNCWEFEACPEDVMRSCPAYPEKGRECWKVTGTICSQGKIKALSIEEKIIHCRNNCRFYREHIKTLYP